ncbi:hypothetical protein [Anaerosacchariphilus polymeriproducens]|nr:hypothetical protein [Anaerosacchariphilus polymeriproducens]
MIHKTDRKIKRLNKDVAKVLTADEMCKHRNEKAYGKFKEKPFYLKE